MELNGMNKKTEENKILEGAIRVTSKGVGYFPIQDESEDYEIQPENLNTALNHDKVRIALLDKEILSRKQAKVLKIVERHKTEFVGMLEKDGDVFFLVPDDKRMYRDILVPIESALGASDKYKVQV